MLSTTPNAIFQDAALDAGWFNNRVQLQVNLYAFLASFHTCKCLMNKGGFTVLYSPVSFYELFYLASKHLTVKSF